MSGSATLTMNRSRLASTTPAQTITSTIVDEASPRRVGNLLIKDTFPASGSSCDRSRKVLWAGTRCWLS